MALLALNELHHCLVLGRKDRYVASKKGSHASACSLKPCSCTVCNFYVLTNVVAFKAKNRLPEVQGSAWPRCTGTMQKIQERQHGICFQSHGKSQVLACIHTPKRMNILKSSPLQTLVDTHTSCSANSYCIAVKSPYHWL